jgi:hypothetical protein
MARRVWCVVTACAFLAIGQFAAAQGLGQAAAAARKAPPVEAALRADIERLMDITGQSAMATQLATTISDALLNSLKSSQKNVPPRAIEIARDVLNTEFATAFAGSDIKDKQVALYAKYYTHADIKGLLSFYESDLGKKMIANNPALMREGAAIGQDWAKATMPALMQKLQARFKEEGLIP